MKTVIILRGLPGSGKSTFAEYLSAITVDQSESFHIEADKYFMKDGEYKFDVKKLFLAHKECMRLFKTAIEEECRQIIISNTSTRESEFKDYMKLAKEAGYVVFSVVVENRHEGNSVHNVPEETLQKMRDRFEVNL